MIKKEKLEIDIREMELDDLPQVFHLGEKLFTSEEVPNLYHTWDEYELTEFFLSESDSCLVADNGEKIIGFILGSTLTKYRSAWKYGHLTWIGVDENFRKIGVANKLFIKFLEIMKNEKVRMIIADTEADNKYAIEFFKKKGFGKIKKHVYMSLNVSKKSKKRRKKYKNINAK